MCGFLLALSACSASGPGRKAVSERGYPLGDLEIRRGDRAILSLEVEIAETEEARSLGLMGVERLDPASGMVFIMDSEGRGAFWMKSTLIPLDIAFWDGQGRIVDFFGMEPCREDPCPIYSPENDYVAAVEMNRGLLARAGVRRGDTVVLNRRS